MAKELTADSRFDVIAAIDQDEAVNWHLDRWAGLDLVIVDIFDELAPGEVGTDVYSGIAALDRLRHVDVKTLAIAPHCQHPLIQLRIHQAGANWLYHRWEVNDPQSLVAAILDPSDDHVPQRPDDALLMAHGAHRARANEAVSVYGRSRLFGRLRPGIGIKSLGFDPRSRIPGNFRRSIARTGFEGTKPLVTESTSLKAPRWELTRDYVLTLLGRRLTPASELDREDGLRGHPTAGGATER